MKLIRFLLFSFVFILPSSAQIIIDAGDVQAQYAVGNSVSINTDTIVSTINIGGLGSTSWDFSFLTSSFNYAITLTSVDPASTPYISDFPGADYSMHGVADIQGILSESYSYLKLGSNFENMGSGATSSSSPGFEIISTYDPDFIVGKLPTTFNTNWNYTSSVTTVTYQNGNPVFITTSTEITENVVDAYGPMTLPGGIVVDALRIREDKITLTDIGGFIIYDRNISYTFLGKNGEQVSVPSDTTEPNIGLIRNSASISWNSARVTAVENEYPLPNKFSLEQNYPNPFNPSTSIQYAIDGRRFVSLKVFDVLGNEVATLVKEEKPTGVYEVNFNATQLSSGIYFYTLKAGSFIETKKLILMK